MPDPKKLVLLLQWNYPPHEGVTKPPDFYRIVVRESGGWLLDRRGTDSAGDPAWFRDKDHDHLIGHAFQRLTSMAIGWSKRVAEYTASFTEIPPQKLQAAVRNMTILPAAWDEQEDRLVIDLGKFEPEEG